MNPFQEDLAQTMQCMPIQALRLRDAHARELILCPIPKAERGLFWIRHGDAVYVGRYLMTNAEDSSSSDPMSITTMPDGGYFEDFVQAKDLIGLRLTLSRSYTYGDSKHVRILSQEFLEAHRV